MEACDLNILSMQSFIRRTSTTMVSPSPSTVHKSCLWSARRTAGSCLRGLLSRSSSSSSRSKTGPLWLFHTSWSGFTTEMTAGQWVQIGQPYFVWNFPIMKSTADPLSAMIIRIQPIHHQRQRQRHVHQVSSAEPTTAVQHCRCTSKRTRRTTESSALLKIRTC